MIMLIQTNSMQEAWVQMTRLKRGHWINEWSKAYWELGSVSIVSMTGDEMHFLYEPTLMQRMLARIGIV